MFPAGCLSFLAARHFWKEAEKIRFWHHRRAGFPRRWGPALHAKPAAPSGTDRHQHPRGANAGLCRHRKECPGLQQPFPREPTRENPRGHHAPASTVSYECFNRWDGRWALSALGKKGGEGRDARRFPGNRLPGDGRGQKTSATHTPSSRALTLPDWACLFGSNWAEGLDLLFPERQERDRVNEVTHIWGGSWVGCTHPGGGGAGRHCAALRDGAPG